MRWVILDDVAVNLDRVQYAYVDEERGTISLYFGVGNKLCVRATAAPELACAIGFPRCFDKPPARKEPEP